MQTKRVLLFGFIIIFVILFSIFAPLVYHTPLSERFFPACVDTDCPTSLFDGYSYCSLSFVVFGTGECFLVHTAFHNSNWRFMW
ncbi:MAG: hypothetical protein JRN20_13595 [Nitrososphaerota archaeon]|nr:hypothetical protein [Nitrososphaerota archaeon]MDG6923377.1 hypothetical protein [Nitrososphaerota archaeon]